jgi:ATP-dependent Clp protease protease subunit
VCFLIFRSVFPWLLLSFCAGGNTYELKTGLPREEISRLMNEESCFNAKKAVQLGFADGVLYAEQEISDALKPVIFSRMAVTNSLLRKIPTPVAKTPGTEYSDLEHRLENLSH